MEISVKTNVKEFEKNISRLFKDQIPFATSLAINETAWGAKLALEKQARIKLDNPTPFTQKGFRTGRRATKRDLSRDIFIAPIAASYLKHIIDGTTRTPKGKTLAPPVAAKLNKYGNVPRNARKKVANNKKRYFSGKPKGGGVAGIWERTNRNKKIRLLYVYKPSTKGSRRFDFYKIVNGYVKNTFDREMKKAIEKAIRTAR